MPSPDSLLKVQGLSKSFGDLNVLKDIDFQVQPGTTTGVIGPSGSGKSTLIRCLNFLEFFEGKYYFQGDLVDLKKVNLNEFRQHFGMVFQHFNLFPHLSVLENICVAPVNVQKRKPSEVEKQARKLLDRIGLSDKTDEKPGSLSGGQKQRVAIARALAVNPEVLLFDEPTSALDPEMVGDVLAVIDDLKADDMTMVIVSHEMDFIRKTSDQVLFLDEGQLLETGPPDKIFGSDNSERLKAFLQKL